MNPIRRQEHTEELDSYYDPNVAAPTLLELPSTITEQKGVLQIVEAEMRYEEALSRGDSAHQEREELNRLADSMREVTSTAANLINHAVRQAGLGRHILEQTWSTKTPESTFGKVCANIEEGKREAIYDVHRGMLVVSSMPADVFAEKLAEILHFPEHTPGTIAVVERFNSPHADQRLREQSRKVIVMFPHKDGEHYVAEIQLHNEEGIEVYRRTRTQYESRREFKRADAKKKVLGGIALGGADLRAMVALQV